MAIIDKKRVTQHQAIIDALSKQDMCNADLAKTVKLSLSRCRQIIYCLTDAGIIKSYYRNLNVSYQSRFNPPIYKLVKYVNVTSEISKQWVDAYNTRQRYKKFEVTEKFLEKPENAGKILIIPDSENPHMRRIIVNKHTKTPLRSSSKNGAGIVDYDSW